MNYAKLKAMEYYLPEHVLTNEDIHAEFPEWSIEKISKKTGISKRFISSSHETSLDLGIKACQKLFEKNSIDAAQVDALVFCTQSTDYKLPPNSSLLQNALGLPKRLFAVDIAHGCSGFIYCLSLAKSLIESKQAQNVLLVTAETYTKFLNPKDRSVRTLFSDGAAACFVSGEESTNPYLDCFHFETDGGGYSQLFLARGGMKENFVPTEVKEKILKDGLRTLDDLFMDGPEVFNFSMAVVPELVQKTLIASNIKKEEIDKVVFHQANKFMLENLRLKCGFTKEQFVVEIENFGNTVSSTIPIALKESIQKGVIKQGDKVLLTGFGVGLSSGACIIEL